MRVLLILTLAALPLALTGCGRAKPGPSGEVYEGKHVSEWADGLKSPDRQTRLHAAKVLYKMGKEGHKTNPAIPALQTALADEDVDVRGWAALALIPAARGTPFPVGAVVQPKLKEATESADGELKAEASQTLETMASRQAEGQGGPPGGPAAGGEAGPPAGPAGAKERKAPPEDDKPAPKDDKKPAESRKSAKEKGSP